MDWDCYLVLMAFLILVMTISIMDHGISPYFPNFAAHWNYPGNFKIYWPQAPTPRHCGRGCGLGFRIFKNFPGDSIMQPEFGNYWVKQREALKTTVLKHKKI